MSGQFLLAIDQGTTGSTVLVVDVQDRAAPRIVARETVDFPQHYPQTGWVEHDLEEIWQSVEKAARGALAKAASAGCTPRDVVALGITNQRETTCVFDRKSGKPLHRAIVWQCKRSTDICARIKRDGLEDAIRARTGLVVDPYFSGTKITWLMENAPEVKREVERGAAVFGTIDTFLVHRLTGCEAHVTEASNASRTLLYDIGKGDWDDDLLKTFGVPSRGALPEVRDSAGLFGKTKGLGFLPDGIPIAGILGDQQAALAGQTCFGVGEAKCTYGTGAFLLLNLGHEKLASSNGLLTTVAWSLGGKRTYAFEGSSFIAGASIQFLRDQFEFLKHSAESEAMARGVTAAPEVYFVPALAGLGAPYWDPKAQGAFFGLTRGTTKGQLVRAALEGMAFQVVDLVRAMDKDARAPLKILRVDGGAAANDLLLESQADFLGVPVDRPEILETTAFGAALFAGLGVGVFADLQSLAAARKTARVFEPDSSRKERVSAQLAGWERAIRAVRTFAGTI